MRVKGPRPLLALVELVKSKGAASLALLCRGKVFMILRHDFTWAFPGGSLDSEEKSLQAALREFQEEIGVAPPPYQMLTALTGTTVLGRRHTLWVAECQEPMLKISPSKREVFETAWFYPKEALRLGNLHHGVRENLLFIHYLPRENASEP
jgi:8-oxo-dGTP pyrophosphatase MutT (NUDIX family)